MSTLPSSSVPWVRRVIRALGLALAYYLTGRLALLLAIPPGYATAIWPASGVALVGLLLWGWRTWPGVFLGSFLVNIGASLESTHGLLVIGSLAVPAGIAAGASLQALVGSYLIRRFVGFPSALTEGREIATFLVLSGPVSSLVSASWGVSCLLLAHLIEPAQFLFNWWTWWVGDTIGILIGAPIALIGSANPRPLWSKRWVSVALPLAVMGLLVIVLFVRISSLEEERLRLELEKRTEQITQTLRKNFDAYLEVLHSFQDLYAASAQIDRQTFQSFVERPIRRNKGIKAVSWAVRVTDAQRDAYQQGLRGEGFPDFHVWELGEVGARLPAAHRPEYVIVSYIEPLSANIRALGADIASEPQRRLALHLARDTGQPVATGRMKLVQSGTEDGLLAYLAVYRKGQLHDTVETRQANLVGFVTAVFHLGEMLEATLAAFDRTGLVMRITDTSNPKADIVLFDDTPTSGLRTGESTPDGFARVVPFEFASRHWSLRFALDPRFMLANRSWQPWTVLAAGMLFTGLLGAFLLLSTGRTARIEEQVAQRTSELVQANAQMAAAQAIAHVGSWEWSFGGDALKWSDELYRIYGLEKEPRPLSHQGFLARVHPEDRDRVTRTMQESARTGQAFNLEHRIVRPNGDTRTVHTVGQPQGTAAGAHTALSGTGQDVTERSQAEARFEGLLETAPDAMVIANEDGSIALVNAQAERLFGYARKEMLGQPVEMLIPARLRGHHPEHRQHYSADPKPRGMGSSLDLYGLRKDGTEFPVEVSLSPLRTHGRTLVSSTIRDITERKATERRLQASLKEKEVLLREVHHRVKNNLQVVSSLLSLQGQHVKEADLTKYFEESQNRLRSIALAHEHIYQSDDLGRINLLEYTRTVSTSILQTYGDRSSPIKLQVTGDQTTLELDAAVPSGLIITELVSNALKHAFPDGRDGCIRVDLRHAPLEKIALTVSDNGVGLPPSLDWRRSTSLGLQLVHSLAKQLRGTVEIKNGEGVEVVVTFPVPKNTAELEGRARL